MSNARRNTKPKSASKSPSKPLSKSVGKPERESDGEKGGVSAGIALDREALGLLLAAAGFFLAVTLLFPLVRGGAVLPEAQSEAGPLNLTGGLRRTLLEWLGVAAYLLPLPLLAYAALVFLERPLARLHRAVLGGILFALALMCLLWPFAPAYAGAVAGLLMGPLRTVLGVAALLLLVPALAVGLDLLLGLPPLTLLRRLGHAGSRAGVGFSDWVGDKMQERREGRASSGQRRALRRELRRHLGELETMQRLYPDRRDLETQRSEIESVVKSLRGLTEDDLAHFEQALRDWDKSLDDLSLWAARDLAAKVGEEAQEEREALEASKSTLEDIRSGRHELGAELASTAASSALDELRRRWQADLTRLVQHAGKLERARAGAETNMARATKPSGKQALSRAARIRLLQKEARAYGNRVDDWRKLAQGWHDWRAAVQPFAGWPDLVAAYDRLAGEQPALELARELKRNPQATLQARAAWEETLEREGATVPTYAPQVSADFAVTEPMPTRLAARGAPAHTAPLPTFDLSLEDDALVEDASEIGAEAKADAGGRKTTQDWQPEPPAATPAARTANTPPWEGARVGVAQATVGRSAEPTNAEARIAEKLAAVGAEARRPKQGALELALPSTDLLDPVPPAAQNTAALDVDARKRAALIDQTLKEFNLQGRVVDFARGPTVTRYEIEPAPGEKISRISSLSNDLARALAVAGVRIEAPVPGKNVIGLEVPNARREPVTFHQAVSSTAFTRSRAALPIILGKSIDGKMLVGDLVKMPHMLIAGSTGSGKSVCVNTLIQSLLFRFYPQQLRFLMIDPKMVELTPYDGIPHLVRGVVTNPTDAAGVLLGAVAHMERRYKMMSQVGAKNLEQFNAKMRQIREPELPHLVIIIDELADLMITSPKEVEASIMRLAQMARATGMHLVLATQRPSVDILTSLIKVNVPARVAFAVSSSHDSRTILDSVGAERLTGMGDMLFYQPGLIKPMRLQGPFISEEESVRVTGLLQRMLFEDEFGEAYGSDFDGAPMSEGGSSSVETSNMDFSDPYLRQAAQIVIEEGQASVSRLQRRLSVGHARAGKLMDMLEAMNIVGKHQGSKPRDVLITEADLPEYFGR